MHPRRLYAHRGASAEWPENTLPAFERAHALGVDALEMDLQVTRDDVLIVAHDNDGARTTGTPARWDALDLRAVRELDAGWGFVAANGERVHAGRGIRVATFVEVLDAFPNMLLNVDVKSERALALVLPLLEQRGAAERVTLAAFQTRTAIAMRRRGYPGPTALSQGEVASLLALPAMLWRQMPYTGNAAQVPVAQGALRLDRASFVAKCHAIGLRIDFWTIDDPAEAARLLALGADGIMTNDPAAIRPVMQQPAH